LANLNQPTTSLDSTFSPDQTVTVVDPRHALCGRTLPLLGITQKSYLGRCCVVLIRTNVERHVPVSATDLEFNPNDLSPIPLSIASIRQLVHVFLRVTCASQGEEAHGAQSDLIHSANSTRVADPVDPSLPGVDQPEPQPPTPLTADHRSGLPGTVGTGRVCPGEGGIS
jgi:hypothetical protein